MKVMNQSRALLDTLRGKYQKYPNVIITDSYLLLMKSLQATITTISFDVLSNVGNATVLENRLSITDRFAVKDMAVCIMKAGASTTATSAEIAVGRPNTYPNTSVYTGAAEAVNLEAIYNSQLRVVIDSKVFYQSLDTRRFFRVPTSQQGVAVSTQGAGAAPGLIQRDGWDSLNYAFSPVAPNFEFSGSGKNEVTLTLPNPTLTSGTSSQNFVLAYFRGFLIQNINQPIR